LNGLRVCVVGLGRAGIGMAVALKRSGAFVHAVDEKSGDAPEMIQAGDRLGALDILMQTDWTGSLDFDLLDALAVSPGVPRDHPAIRGALASGKAVWGEMEVAYRVTRSPIVAITGTNGKSTVTALTWHILRVANKGAHLCGNIAGAGLGERAIGEVAASSAQDEFLIAEVSSFQLEWVDEFRPSVATITNITPDHLDRYATFEEYAQTKHRVFAQMRENDVAVLSRLHPETIPDSKVKCRTLYVGGSADDASVSDSGVAFAGGAMIEAKDVPLMGKHNLENVAVAGLLARASGAPWAAVEEGVRTFRGLANRMEIVADVDGVRYINNSMCTNPDALRASVSAISNGVRLLAGGISKAPRASDFRGVLPANVKAAYLFGRDGDALAEQFRSDGIECYVFETMDTAFDAARHDAQRGEVVLLSPGCASFDQFSSFEERGERFRACVLTLMEAAR